MNHDIIVIAASAGGVETLRRLVELLPKNLSASVFITLHVSRMGTSVMPSILSRAGAMPACHPIEGAAIQRGMIYVAPPDHHLLLRAQSIHLSHGPKENGTRPAADPMFRSAARMFGGRVIGVVLSGMLDDGSAGLEAIKARSGITIAQDPATALFPDMPKNAIARGVVDHIAPIDELAPLLVQLVQTPSANAEPMSRTLEVETNMADLDLSILERDAQRGNPTDFTCPDCGGVLRRLDSDGGNAHFRCHVGHAWATESLQTAQVERVEESLWAALRVLDENAKLVRNLHTDAVARDLDGIAQHYGERLQEISAHAAAIRDLLLAE
ncbi:MAG TPA: chemotaxis protein CheB [Spongiibacteraceae bacterium]|jgi:two-component system chemotaxis response regulator CheB